MKWPPRLLLRPRDADAASRDDADEQAMRRIAATGDPAAFTGVVARWEAPIRRLCIRMTGDEHRGEDLAQETFARVFAHRQWFDPQRRFSTWLWRIALNLCYEESRRSKLRDATDVVPDVGSTGDGP